MIRFPFFIVMFLLCCEAHAADIDFDTEIVPLLSKAGCNAASCHGGAAGQGGFRLSLFGGDSEFDYRTIVRELGGRRVNLVRPVESLLIAKPTEQLEHGGGSVLDYDSQTVAIISNWIAAGTPRLQLRRLEQLSVEPPEVAAASLPTSFQLRVIARFSDGLERDVTDDAIYSSQNDAALNIDESGNVAAIRPGRHSAIVRFGGLVKTISVTSPIGEHDITIPANSKKNWIDDEINSMLKSLRLPPEPQASDNAFARRLSLDLTGRLPLPSQVAGFVADSDESKRTKLLDEILDSAEFVEYWTHRLATQLRLRKPGVDDAAADAFHRWLKQQVADDVGWDRIAESLVMSEGDTHQTGAATVHRYFATPREEAEYMSEVLLGVRLRCANCHNHPLDQWTQDDYHGFAAIFAGLERGQTVRFSGRGEVIHPRTRVAAIARIPGDYFVTDEVDARPQLTKWLTDRDNPYFAKAMVGRVWEALMGRGLVTPVDDLRATNPASHPRLLRRLSECFAENEFKLRPLIRLICSSATYGRKSAASADGAHDDRFYSHALPKPLSAEVLADAISDVTGVADDFGGVERAINVVDRATTSGKLQFLGQCLPGEACSAATSGQRGIASKLHLMNGPLLNDKIRDENGRLQKLLRSNTSTEELVIEFYVRALSRFPTEQELTNWTERIDIDAPGKAARCEDFLWALLNCNEFTTNQ